MPLIMVGGSKPGPVPASGYSAILLGKYESDTDNSASYTAGAFDFGAYTSDRRIIVILIADASAAAAKDTATFSIGDDNSPILDAEFKYPGSIYGVGFIQIWRGAPTDVGVANIIATPVATANWSYVSMHAYRTTDPIIPFDIRHSAQLGTSGSAGAPPCKLKIEIPAGGFVIAGSSKPRGDNGATYAWSANIIDDGYNAGVAGSFAVGAVAGHLNNHSGQSVDEITMSVRAGQSMLAVSYGAITDVKADAWNQVYVSCNAFSTNGMQSYTISSGTLRVTIPAALLSNIPGSPTKIRLLFTSAINSGSSQPMQYDKYYIGHAHPSTNDVALDLTPVTVGGSAAFTLNPGDCLWSDEISFAYDGTSNLMLSFYANGGSTNDGMMAMQNQTGARTSRKGAVDEAATLSVSGYSTSAFGTDLIGGNINMIEMSP